MAENEYIERSAFRRELIDRQITTQFFNQIARNEIGCIVEMLDNAPAADVAEVRHGTWTLRSDGSGTCSECGFTQKNVWDYDNQQRFCGVCGAKMDSKRKEETT
jgi:hypothetical protein